MNIYKIFRPLIFKLDPEKAHNLAINFLKCFPNAATVFSLNREYENLRTKLWNIDFLNPIGMAAGFDKNAETISALSRFGFGFIEVGTVTPKAQAGNEKPRMFRLKQDKAIINRLGFNNLGAEVFAKNLERISRRINYLSLVIGINLGKNKDTENALDDYLPLIEKFYQQASYITINISSPNTKGLRDLQKEENLDLFLAEIVKKRDELQEKLNKNTPILIKLAPDLTLEEQETIAKIILKNHVDGLIISNTTIDRNLDLKSQFSTESGGLSGAPLFDKSTEVLRNFYHFTEKKIPIIAVGGISSAQDAYQKIRNGASLVQIYSAFIYQGFGLVERVKKELSQMVKNDGFTNIGEAIGFDADF